MKRAFFVQCVAFLSGFMMLCGSAAQAEIDSRLIGYWLCKTAPGPNWSVWHIKADGKSVIQYIGGEDNEVVLQSSAATIKKRDSNDDMDEMAFAVKTDDQVALCSGAGLAMMVRVSEDRWNAMRTGESAQSFPEYSDNRFGDLNDKVKQRALLCNLDPTMIGAWLWQGANGQRGIWNFSDSGIVALRSFSDPNKIDGWVMRHGSLLLLGIDPSSDRVFKLKFKMVAPNEMTFVDDQGKTTLLMQLPSTRADELYSLKPDALAGSPEYIKLDDEYKKLGAALSKNN